MKTIAFVLIALLSVSCKNKEDNNCNCVQQKWERSVIKEMNTQNIISANEWQVSGSTNTIGSDCDDNGRVTSSGSENSHPIGNNQYSTTEFKYQIKCN